MTQEDKQLLLIDLCARLPYGVICVTTSVYYDNDDNEVGKAQGRLASINYNEASFVDDRDGTTFCADFEDSGQIGFKPYLRPLSSMTEEEKTLMASICLKNAIGNVEGAVSELSDFYNSRHFDYRGLIEKGIALEAPEEMYKTE